MTICLVGMWLTETVRHVLYISKRRSLSFGETSSSQKTLVLTGKPLEITYGGLISLSLGYSASTSKPMGVKKEGDSDKANVGERKKAR